MRDLLNEVELEMLGRVGSDDAHIAKAHECIKEAMRELLACRYLDTPVIHAMRLVNEVEDVLWQYVKK